MHFRRPSNKPCRGSARRTGQTLLELVAASGIIAIALTPALRIMRDSLTVSRDLETANALATLSVDKLEEYLSRTCGQWGTDDASGNFADRGYPQLRYTLSRGDDASEGGIPDRLMVLTAVSWDDRNGNSVLDQNEKSVRFSTKLSRSVSYHYEARGE
ncbi:MAG: hypothetical protein SFX18_02965 [Pirellulales bacterium]|nr:hypothetical protein [Pirellulales bacterium]